MDQMIFEGLTVAIDRRTIFMLALGVSVLCVFLGIFSTFAGRDPVVERMRAASATYGRDSRRRDLLKTPDQMPEGVLKALIPEKRSERTQIRAQLQRAGFDSPNTVRNFFVLRLGLAMFAPTLAILVFSIREFFGMPSSIDEWLNGITNLQATQTVAVLTAIGFYTPTFWLNRKIKARQVQIQLGFPNALDLLQIATEAGLGFDAAMTRVGQRLAYVCEPVSEEFLMCQAEILASRDRRQALEDMAERMGVEEVDAFVQVVVQSMEYGTSISTALNAYALEMRETREMKAVEKANKLPVQMSAVMASMMLPALFLITLGPTVIRYLEVFGD